MSVPEARQLLAWLTYSDYALEHDVPDLLAFLVASGCRIGEALGLTWDRVNLDAGTVLIDRQAIRSKGHGLRLMPTKTDAGVRTLVVPVWGRRGTRRPTILLDTRRQVAPEPREMDVVGGFHLADGTELKVVSGIDDSSRFGVSAKLVRRATAGPVCEALLAAQLGGGVVRSDLRRERDPASVDCAKVADHDGEGGAVA
jgi:hypothetical protein